MGKSNPLGHKSHKQGFSQSESQLTQGGVSDQEIRILQPPNELQTFKLSIVQQKAAKDRRSFVIAELSKKGKVTFDVEGNSDTGSFFAENLPSQEAEKVVKLLAELSKKDEVSFGVRAGNSDKVYLVAENLEPKKAVKLVTDIKQGKIDLEELREWGEVEGRLNKFINSIGELANETTISVAAGIVSELMVILLGPGVAIATSLGMAVMEKAIQGNYSVTSSILGGELFTLLGPVGAVLIPLAGTTAKLLPDKMSHE